MRGGAVVDDTRPNVKTSSRDAIKAGDSAVNIVAPVMGPPAETIDSRRRAGRESTWAGVIVVSLSHM